MDFRRSLFPFLVRELWSSKVYGIAKKQTKIVFPEELEQNENYVIWKTVKSKATLLVMKIDIENAHQEFEQNYIRKCEYMKIFLS